MRKKDWAFIADLLMAAIPMIDAIMLGYGWASYLVFWSAFAILSALNKGMLRRGWPLWLRLGLRLAAAFTCEWVVALGKTEVCSAAGDCHTALGATALALILGVLLLAALFVRHHLTDTVQFWLVAQRHPEAALAALRSAGCLVDSDPDPSQRAAFANYRFHDRTGAVRRIWFPRGSEAGMQAQVLAAIKREVASPA